MLIECEKMWLVRKRNISVFRFWYEYVVHIFLLGIHILLLFNIHIKTITKTYNNDGVDENMMACLRKYFFKAEMP